MLCFVRISVCLSYLWPFPRVFNEPIVFSAPTHDQFHLSLPSSCNLVLLSLVSLSDHYHDLLSLHPPWICCHALVSLLGVFCCFFWSPIDSIDHKPTSIWVENFQVLKAKKITRKKFKQFKDHMSNPFTLREAFVLQSWIKLSSLILYISAYNKSNVLNVESVIMFCGFWTW